MPEREINEWLTLGAELFGNFPDHASQDFSAIYVSGFGEATTSLSDRDISFCKAGAQPTPRS